MQINSSVQVPTVVAVSVADEGLTSNTVTEADPEWLAVPLTPNVDRAESSSASVADDSEVDEFAAAAKLFSFTGELPIQVAAAAMATDARSDGDPQTSVRRGWGRFRGTAVKRATTTSLSISIVGVVGLLAVGMTTPAQALSAASASSSTTSLVAGGDVLGESGEIQAYVAPADVENAAISRSDYSTGSIAATAAELGITQPTDFYVNDPDAAIQWPFAVGVSISYGFGMRSGGFHEGADFVPGAGAHVQAIAAGTVRIATESGGAYGVTVVIDHEIDGQLVSTRYGHMQYGSLQVSVGDVVEAGQFIGQTGNTGHSFGAHTHVEVLMNGVTPIDPIAWLEANAGRDSLG
ncbi:murein DD-endopeptidase MepM/ murein hydrolase activator NlpD [Microbacterium endophyticum]|uniref:Murein DD-endopeptidase MepM/ murein hydrolase activator NlpD n=1 Tax=Microbacterium endophyticum TaxID=1526412 RepID=A0A7W4V512_9MICO|nr:M23 family metallopeptidase [Microbacterium endophyticum]MBB2976654.1 murein DD-endopeptidase MepM/ murein hydrolase activator NlpD [Microbacterium endophyticum]NIK37713.1 murein DD-endopeptidase MepM/ murein hydrolase activator NlpD [Microbacterium endophyticum]